MHPYKHINEYIDKTSEENEDECDAWLSKTFIRHGNTHLTHTTHNTQHTAHTQHTQHTIHNTHNIQLIRLLHTLLNSTPSYRTNNKIEDLITHLLASSSSSVSSDSK